MLVLELHFGHDIVAIVLKASFRDPDRSAEVIAIHSHLRLRYLKLGDRERCDYKGTGCFRTVGGQTKCFLWISATLTKPRALYNVF